MDHTICVNGVRPCIAPDRRFHLDEGMPEENGEKDIKDNENPAAFIGIYGNFQMFPRPIAAPAATMM